MLCVDDDRDIAEIVQAVLTDEGYEVSCLYDGTPEIVARTVGILEPDCILLDGGSPLDFPGWAEAAAIRRRRRPVPVIMFSASQPDTEEAIAGTSTRALDAAFADVILKPFDLDELVAAVAKAVGRSVPFERGDAADGRRTEDLIAGLRRSGATDIRPSSRREWVTFHDRVGRIVQLYWWQQRGVYLVGRYGSDGVLEMVGQVTDRDAAVELAMRADPAPD